LRTFCHPPDLSLWRPIYQVAKVSGIRHDNLAYKLLLRTGSFYLFGGTDVWIQGLMLALNCSLSDLCLLSS
jgi:hypothetical protein